MISALEAARSFSRQARHFAMRTVFRLNLFFLRWPNARSFKVLQANTCAWYSYFLIVADDVLTDQVAKVATTRTRLVVEQMCFATSWYSVLSMRCIDVYTVRAP